MQPAATTSLSIPPGVWIAIGSFLLALIVQLVVVVRHYTKLEGSIAMVSKDVENVSKEIARVDKRVESVESKLDASKVVMLRPHSRGGV